MYSMKIEDCDVITLKNGYPQINQHQDILIQGNRISAITVHKDTPPEAEVSKIAGAGMLAIPGLINTHAHVPMTLFRSLAEDVSFQAWFNEYIWPLEANLTAEDVYWGAMLGLAEMIENGITCFADHYFYMDEVGKAVKETGLRANLSWAIFAHEGEAKLDAACEFVQRWNGQADGRITAWLGPHAPYTTTPEYLKLCSARAREMGVGIHTHVSETADQVTLCRRDYGCTPVQMLAESGVFSVPTILGHCLYPEEEDYRLLEQANTGVAHAPKTYMKLGMGNAPLEKFRASSIPVGLATDGVVSSNTLDILEQMRLMALTQKLAKGDSTVMNIQEVLDIAFRGAAKVMKMEDDIGCLEAGKLADIALIRQDNLGCIPRYNPAASLVYSISGRDVDTVICDGKLLMHGRRLLTIDAQRVKDEVQNRLQRLNQRIPGRRIAFYPA